MRTSIHLSRGLVFAILFLVGSFLLGAPSVAQGTAGMVAEPMGLREARSYLERYSQLQEVQWPMVEAAHDKYLVEFQKLREGAIEKYLKEVREVNQGGMGSMPTLEAMEELFREGKRVGRRIEAIDNGFFESVALNLEASQVPGLQRARSARARQRYMSNAMVTMGGYGMSTLEKSLWDMGPTPEELVAIDGALKGYEARMTKLGARLEEEGGRTMLNMVEALVAAGFGDIDQETMVNDPELARELMEILPRVMAESTQELQALREKMFECEMDTARQMRLRLSNERTRRLYGNWITGNGSMGALSTNVSKIGERAIKSGDLTEDQVVEVRRIVDDWLKVDIRHLEDMLENSAELMRLQMNGGMLDSEAMQDTFQAFSTLAQEREADATSAKDRILAMLDAGKAEAIGLEVVAEDFGGPEITEGVGMVVGSNMVSAVGGPSTSASDGGELLSDDLVIIAALLDLEFEQTRILVALHDGYLEAWRERVVAPREELAGINLWSEGENGAFEMDQEASRRRADMARTIYQDSLEVDRAFLADLRATFVGEDDEQRMAAVEQFRAFDRLDRLADLSDNGEWIAISGVSVGLPNPYRILERLDLEEAVLFDALDGMVAAQPMIASTIDGYEEVLFKRNQDFDTGFMFNADPEDMTQIQDQVARLMEASRANYEDVQGRMEIIRAALAAEIAPRLTRVQQLEMEVLLLDAMRGGQSDTALAVTRRVLRMADLTDGQRAAIETILADYLEANLEFAEEMRRVLAKKYDKDIDGFQQQMMRGQDLQKIDFRRKEQSDRLLDRLKVLLEDHQLARVPALGERR